MPLPMLGSIRVRLTAWYAGAMAIGLLVFAAASFWIIRREIDRRGDRLLDEAARAFGAELQLEFRMLGSRERAVDETLRGVRFRGIALGVLSASPDGGVEVAADSLDAGDEGTVLREAARAALQESLARLHLAVADSVRRVTIARGRGGVAVRVRLLPVRMGDGSVAMVVAARDRRDDREALRQAALIFLGLVVAALAVAIAGGYVLTRRTLLPIAAISRQAQAIGAADLSARVPVANPGDELGALAQVINGLLHRLESAFALQRQFVADASHELRTPVAIIRNEASVALTRSSRREEEYRHALGIVQQESERLTTLVEDLFLLARADAGDQPPRREPLYLDELLREVVRSTRTLAAARDVRVDVQTTGDGEFQGDVAMLRRALLNLLDNALKFSPPGATVRLSLKAGSGWWDVGVADEGPGIPVAEQARVFDRFYRGDGARTRVRDTVTSGAGLGLAIARYIATAHDGTLTIARSDSRGTCFLLRLPAVP